ncbi:MAG: selenium metabolism-associated LysR family transcriptional regulator [Syntrophaceae bacterium]
MDYNLNLLRIFRTVAKLQSFTRAAEVLCLTQPGISKHIKTLENHYKTTLFDRLGKKVVLTETGEALLSSVEKIFYLIERSREEINDLKGLNKGILKIGASITIGVYFLPGILEKFKKLYPGTRITLDIDLNRQVIRQVLENEADIGLLGAPAGDERLVMTPFHKDELVVIAPGNKSWAKRDSISADDLLCENFILSRSGSGTRAVIEERLKAAGVVLKNTMEFGNTEAIKKAVEAGLGISIVSKSAVSREVQLGVLKSIPLSGIDLKRDFYLIYRKDKYISTLIKTFLEFVIYKSY